MRRGWQLMMGISVGVLLGSPGHSLGGATVFDGVWHGTLSSRNYSAVPVTLIINQGVGVKLAGAVTLSSPCLRNADLALTTEGSNLVLAGEDSEGATITFRGSVDDK